MNSCEILRAIDNVAALPSKNDKAALLSAHLTEPAFQRVMKLMLNPLISFYKRPARSLTFGNQQFTDETWTMLDRLAMRELSGNAASKVVETALSSLTPESSELLWRILHRDPRAGFSEGSVNKIIPLLIPEVPYMRCSLPSDVDLDCWPWATGVLIQEKADGTFFNLTIRQGGVVLSSRSGFQWPLELYGELEACFAGWPDGQYHGEMLVEQDGVILAREIGNGMLTSVNKGTPFPMGCKPVPFLWDVIPLASVTRRGQCTTPYSDRYTSLCSVVESHGGDSVRTIQTDIVHSLEEAYRISGKYIRMKKEGAVIKHPDGDWRDTGSSGSPDCVKIKMEAPCELRITGLTTGKGKNAKTFGSLICQSECGQLEVNVSGFSDALRKQIHADPEAYIGGILTVKFMEITFPTKKKKLHSLYLPRFGELRPDRTEADTLARIAQQLEDAKQAIGMLPLAA